jgi:hypothetical protein
MAAICTETYNDALAWDDARRDREVLAICDFLTAHPLLSDADVKMLGAEMRAIRKAGNDQRAA